MHFATAQRPAHEVRYSMQYQASLQPQHGTRQHGASCNTILLEASRPQRATGFSLFLKRVCRAHFFFFLALPAKNLRCAHVELSIGPSNVLDMVQRKYELHWAHESMTRYSISLSQYDCSHLGLVSAYLFRVQTFGIAQQQITAPRFPQGVRVSTGART